MRSRGQCGMASAEFSIVCLLSLLFLFGIIDFGYFFWHKHVVAYAAREGARMAILGGVTENEVRAVVNQKLSVLSNAGEATVNVSSMSSGQPVTVSVTVPFDFFVLSNLLPNLSGLRNVSSSVVMVHEP